MIFPKPFPDEMLASLLARTCRINGTMDFRCIATDLLDNRVSASFVDASVNLAEFSHRTKFLYGEPGVVLNHLTWLGAQAKTAELDAVTLRTFELGERQMELGRMTFDGPAVMGYCPVCRDCDELQYGMTYWRRLHQLSIVRYCPEHGEKIIKVSVKRGDLHQSFPLPGDISLAVDETSLGNAMEEEFWRRVANVVRDIFADNEALDTPFINQTFLDELQERKLLTSAGKLRATVFDTLSLMTGVQHDNNSPTSSRFAKRLLRSLLDPCKGVVLGRAVFICWLFGTWALFKERCRWTAVFGGGQCPSPKHKITLSDGHYMASHHRQVCSVFKNENPGGTRLDFTKSDYRSFRWLLHNDRAWLEQELPYPPRDIAQLQLI